jgi:small subunit ribosomal protein S16
MAVSLRLRREGAKNRPFYRIVAADSRARRDGRFIEAIGTYDPLQAGLNFRINLAKAEYWLSRGAHPSDTVGSMIRKARKHPETCIGQAREEAAPTAD